MHVLGIVVSVGVVVALDDSSPFSMSRVDVVISRAEQPWVNAASGALIISHLTRLNTTKKCRWSEMCKTVQYVGCLSLCDLVKPQ